MQSRLIREGHRRRRPPQGLGDRPRPWPGRGARPGLRGLGIHLGAATDLPVAGGIDADGDQHGHVLIGSIPAALEIDAVDEDEGAAAVERPLPQGPDGRVGPLVEGRDGAGGHRRPPEELRDVLDPPGGNARGAHLDDSLLDRGHAPAVALDDGRIEGRATEFRHAELNLSGPSDELSGVVPAAVDPPARRPLVALGPDEFERLLVEQRVERLLDGLPHQILYVLAQRPLVTDTMFADTARAPSSMICCLAARNHMKGLAP